MIKIEEHTFNPDYLGPNSVVIDVGGNRGNFSIEIVNRFGCTVECFEPDISAYNVIKNRISHPKFTVHNQAVSGVSGKQLFYSACPCNGGSSLLPNSREFGKYPESIALEVDVVSMDSILEKFSTVDLLKLDCEGAEISIFDKSKELKRIKQITVEFHDFCFDCITIDDLNRCINKIESDGFVGTYDRNHKDPDRDYYFINKAMI